MDTRKFRILQAIIDDYILTAIPVGSRTISKKYETGLSSATIRNEMSDLEELGYLDQPHVSAGRIPSAKAYRLYVDQLLKQGKIPRGDVESIRKHFTDRALQMEDVISHATQVLSGMTQYTALAMSPKGKEVRIRNMQLVSVSSTSALVVVVTDTGIMRDSVIRIGDSMDEEALYSISRLLTDQLGGRTLAEAKQLIASMREELGLRQQMITGITELMDHVDKQYAQGKLMLGGTSNILSYPEYNDVEKARSFLSVLEGKDKILQLMQQGEDLAVAVRIGPETGIPELADCSLVTATYRLGKDAQGTIGVIGPTRMRYEHVLGILGAMGEQLTRLLDQDEE